MRKEPCFNMPILKKIRLIEKVLGPRVNYDSNQHKCKNLINMWLLEYLDILKRKYFDRLKTNKEEPKMLKTISYNLDLVKSTAKGKYGIFITPKPKRNILANKESGKRRFYCNERAFKKLKEFFEEQWQNNLDTN